MHQLENKILRLSVVVLFLSILVVYALFYQVKSSEIRDKIGYVRTQENIKIYAKSGDEKKLIVDDADIFRTDDDSALNTGNIMIVTGNIRIDDDNQDVTQDNIRYLSGTRLFYGILESVEKLGISYKYILQDTKGIYYVNLGDFKYDMVSIARKLGGNIYTMNTEQELLKNMLFGNRIVFINLPEYKGKIVLMILYIDTEIWLLQIDYDLYHKSKSYLKSLFID